MKTKVCKACTDSCCFELDVFSLPPLMKKNHSHLPKGERRRVVNPVREGMLHIWKDKK